MSIRQKIEKIIEKSDLVFQEKLEVLFLMKKKNDGFDLGKAILDFQIDLADILFEIEFFRIELITEEKRLKSKMKSYKKDWFISRMKTLSHYKKVLLNLNTIGKSIGDAFVFWFYRFDLELLNEHLNHKRTLYLPLGIGGKGELEFLKKIRAINGKFAIYHGISNILRIGDISLFDFKEINIVSIGEIKTKKEDNNKLNIQVTVLGHKSRDVFKDVVISKGETSSNTYFDKDRFNRQLKSMGKAIEVYNPKENSHNLNKSINEKFNCKFVEDLYYCSSSSNITFIKVSEGLLFSGIKTKHRKSVPKFLDKKKYVPNEEDMKEGTNHLMKIIRKSSSENSMIYGQLLYNDKYLDNSTRGTVPLLWLPIKDEVLKDIYLKNFEVAAVYNPIHLIEKLRAKGIKVQSKYSKKTEPENEKNYPKVTAMYFDLFLPYIINHLQTEESILNIFDTIRNDYSKFEHKGSVKTDIKVQQFIDPFMKKPSR